MPLYLSPDVCPGSRPCVLELHADRSRSVVSLCRHHQGLKAQGLTDAEIIAAIRQTALTREQARWAVKLELMSLGLSKEHPGVPYRVNDDGSIVIITDRESLAWTTLDGTPGEVPQVSNADRVRARARAVGAANRVDKPRGTATVTVD